MSVNLNKDSFTTGFQYVAKHVRDIPDKFIELTFNILNGATTRLGQLLPDLRPTSVGEVVLQTKKHKSAYLSTQNGDYLITITQDKKGRFIFQAISDQFEPVTICEGKQSDSGVIWEVRVSNYLQSIVKQSHSVSYGDIARRWKEDSFTQLKEKFSAEGLLRNVGDGVMLKFPGDDEPLLFKAPYANLKAEIALQKCYLHQKTPIEEEQSKSMDYLKRFFLGYLYVSGFALSPWVQDHVLLSHQRAEMEEEKAQRMTADGYLDGNEIREMAKSSTLRQRVMDIAEVEADQGNFGLLSQLEHITFQSNGYRQTYEYDGTSYEESHTFSAEREVYSRTVCQEMGECEEYITEQGIEDLILTQKTHNNSKIDVQKTTFKREGDGWRLVNEEKYVERQVLQLPDRGIASTILANSQQIMAHSATIYLAALIAKNDPKIAFITSLFHLISRADAFSMSKPEIVVRNVKPTIDALRRRTTSAPITMLYPLPNFSVEPGSQLSYTINLPSYCQLSNPNQNLELSIQQANGLPAPSWISMKMGPLTLQGSLYLGGNTASNVYVLGNYAYMTLGSAGLNIVDISNPSSPAVVGTFAAANANSVFVKGNYAYLLNGKLLQVVNVTNPTTPTLVTTYTVSTGPNNLVQMSAQGNYLYFAAYGIQGANTLNFEVVSVKNFTNLTQVGLLTLNGGNLGLYVSGNYAFIGDNSGTGSFYIVNIGTPTNPVLITTIPLTIGSANAVSFAVKGNFLFVGFGSQLNIYDITTISNPVLDRTVFLGTNNVVQSITLDGNYIYVSHTSSSVSDVTIVDITNVMNAQIVTSFPTLDQTYDASLSANIAYVANGAAGLTVFNAGSRVLSGTPSVSDRGLLLLNVTAQDDLGDSIVDQIAIHVGDVNITPIPNQQVYVGNSTMFTFDPNTFQYPNVNFTYTATLVGGLPLPSCINFDANTRTFLFTPHSGDQNTYTILVTANDGYGGVVSTTFNLVVPDRVPLLVQPLSNQTAYSGTPFNYVVASNSFTDGDNDQLTFTANLVGSNALPGWLSFDPALLRFSGTPVGRGSYQIQLNANDNHGGVVSSIFTITVPPSAPLIINEIGTQLASVNTPFSYQFNSNTFYDLDGDLLTYTTSPLPSFLSFNSATRTFFGTPQTADDGTYDITITATNPFGQTASLPFQLTVIKASNDLPPIVFLQIPDYTITSNTPFNYTISPNTFKDPQNLNLTYAASLEGGNPLPNGLYFNTESLTLYGSVPLPQTLRITIKATDTSGVYNIDTFTLTVLDGTKYPPIVLNPISDEIATVGAAFSMAVPSDTFKDLNGDELTITVSQSGGLPLPEWLNWNPTTFVFSGTPGPFDTDTYSPRVLEINVRAADSVGSVITSFKITVQGESFWATFIKYGFSFGSVAVSALGVWKERALIWNHLCKDKYKGKTERVSVGQNYSHSLKLERQDVKEIRVFFKGKQLSHQKPFPDGLNYEFDKLSGIPTGNDKGRFTICILDQKGYINEEFDLIIKTNENEPDPEIENTSAIESTKMRLSDLRTRFSSKKEVDEEKEVGCFGKISKQFPMRSLNKHDNEANV